MIERPGPETLLIVLLRLGGTVTLLAFLAMFLPVRWMEATHVWLGLGEFPASGLVDYLTRSIAALYGMHGGVLLLVSTDVRRYRPLVAYFAALNVVLGVAFLATDRHAGMPLFWTLAEGPPLAAMGLLMAHLLRFMPRDAAPR